MQSSVAVVSPLIVDGKGSIVSETTALVFICGRDTMPMGCGWLEYPKTEDYQLIAAGGAAGSAERGLMGRQGESKVETGVVFQTMLGADRRVARSCRLVVFR